MISNSFYNFQTSALSAISGLNSSNQLMICSAAATNLTDCWFWRCDKNISEKNYCMNANEVMGTQADDSMNSSLWNTFSDLRNFIIIFFSKQTQLLLLYSETKHIKLWRPTDRLMTVCIWLCRIYRKYSPQHSAFITVRNFI